MRLFALAIALSIASLTCTKAAESRNLDRACQLIKEEVQDCGCTVQFLQRHLGPQLGLLLLKVWAAGEARAEDTSHAFATIYKENDETRVLDASVAFLRVRAQFQAECRPPGSMFAEEHPVLVMSDPWSNF